MPSLRVKPGDSRKHGSRGAGFAWSNLSVLESQSSDTVRETQADSTAVPFTICSGDFMVSASSSGGGLFDECPMTLTGVWGFRVSAWSNSHKSVTRFLK